MFFNRVNGKCQMKMYRIVIIAVISALLTCCFADAAPKAGQVEIPDVSASGENGYIKGELIYSLDNKPTPWGANIIKSQLM